MRVAITGHGCVSPLGTSADALVDSLHAGDLGVAAAPWSTRMPWPSLFAAVDATFDPSAHIDRQVLDGTDRFVHFALTAAAEAVNHAGLLSPGALDPLRTAVVDGTSMGGFYSLMRAQQAFDRGGPEATPPKTMLKVWSNMAAAQVAIAYGLHGPQLTVTTACASGLDALGQAAAMISSGLVDVAICGGSEGGAPIDDDPPGLVPVTAVAGRLLGMETPEIDPEVAVLPLDVRRAGIVFGEGAAWFVLESPAHAAARGASPLAWLTGHGLASEAHHPSSPDPTGVWEARAMELAMAGAGVTPAQVDLILAHATGTPKGDRAEIRAINQVFPVGRRRTPAQVTAIKGNTGHTGASSGGMSVVAAIDALCTGRVSPVRSLAQPDPEIRFDVVTGDSAAVDPAIVVVNAFGFGGQDTSIVLERAH